MNMGNNRWLRNSFVYLMIIIGVIVIFYTLLVLGSVELLVALRLADREQLLGGLGLLLEKRQLFLVTFEQHAERLAAG